MPATLLAALLFLQSGTGTDDADTQPATQAPCSSETHREFDFWVGEWDVFRESDGMKVAESLIEALYAGCAVRENWMPLQGAGGGSLNGVDGETGRWVQRWIGQGGEVVDFEGGLDEDGVMVLTGYWPNFDGEGNAGLVRMEFSQLEGGAVRQHGFVSFDHGREWSTAFNLVYRPRAD